VTNSMRQLKKTILLALVLLIFLAFPAWAFSPGGPIGNNPNPAPGGFGNGDAWQTPSIGYPGHPDGDVNAPKNLGQEYRRNTPVLYYTYDENFLEFFNANNTTNGTAAVDSAIAIFNNLTSVDIYSPQLNEFPLNSLKYNPTAQALGLTDLKSSTLSLLTEQLGLTEPERYVWTLHDRFIPPGGTCPLSVEYNVVQRNFDPVLDNYSSYVNGTLYTYQIDEVCTAPGDGVLAETVPYPVDQAADSYFSVAGGIINLPVGGYYTGLTRDDVGGLRYLLSTNNILKEDPAAGSLWLNSTTNFNSVAAYPPNPNSPNGFGTFDLGALISASKTNDPATLEALFPGVIVASSTSNLAYTTNQTVVAYFTNFLGSQAGSPPVLIIATNISYGFTTVFSDTFANVITNHYYPNSVVTLQTVTVGPLLGAEAPAPLVTNFTSTTVTLPGVPSGDYYLLPTNACGLDILSFNFFTNVLSFTNVSSIFGTNAPASTNSSGTAFSFAQTVVRETNYVFSIHPVTCTQTPNATGLYGGIGQVQFVRADFDSISGQFYQPITNTYTVNAVTNSQYQSRTFQRIVTGPDLTFSAEDLATANANILSIQNDPYVRTDPNWDQNNAGLGLAGPGTINPSTSTRIAFNDVGDVFLNGSLAFYGLATNQFLTEVTAVNSRPFFAWGSFDASTNPPIVYPDNAALTNLENQIIIQISPSSLPNGTNGVFYPPTTFTTTGGAFTRPYTWSSGPVPGISGSGLPAGLILSGAGVLSGIPSGNASGTYFFVIQLTDVNGRSVQWNYSMAIQ
jgi:hypothetical protein